MALERYLYFSHKRNDIIQYVISLSHCRPKIYFFYIMRDSYYTLFIMGTLYKNGFHLEVSNNIFHRTSKEQTLDILLVYNLDYLRSNKRLPPVYCNFLAGWQYNKILNYKNSIFHRCPHIGLMDM